MLQGQLRCCDVELEPEQCLPASYMVITPSMMNNHLLKRVSFALPDRPR